MLLQLINQTLVAWMVYKIHYTRKFQANLRNLGLHSKLTQLIENLGFTYLPQKNSRIDVPTPRISFLVLDLMVEISLDQNRTLRLKP